MNHLTMITLVFYSYFACTDGKDGYLQSIKYDFWFMFNNLLIAVIENKAVWRDG